MGDPTPVVAAAQVPDVPSLGQVALEAFYAAQGMADVTSWAQASEGDRTAWHAAAGAVVLAYDHSLFAEAEQKAQLLGLEPQPVVEPVLPDNV